MKKNIRRGFSVNTHRIFAFAICLILFTLLLGCNKPFTEDQALMFVDEVSLMALEDGDIGELEKKIDEGIDRLNQDQASEVVNALLYAMHQKMPDFNSKMSGLQQIMMDYENVDFNDLKTIEQIKDSTLRALLQEIKENHFKIKKEAGIYMAIPDVEYVLKKYQTYMKDDLKAWSEFINQEYHQTIFDEDEQQFKLDLVLDRILALEKHIADFSDSNFVSGFKNAKSYYYQIYFGMNHEYFVDENQVMLNEILDHYRKTIQDYPESQLAKDLTAYLEKLESEGNKLTDDIYAFLADLTKIETPNVDGQDAVNEFNSVKDAIKEAIEKNEKVQ